MDVKSRVEEAATATASTLGRWQTRLDDLNGANGRTAQREAERSARRYGLTRTRVNELIIQYRSEYQALRWVLGVFAVEENPRLAQTLSTPTVFD